MTQRLTTLQKLACGETYEDMKGWIVQICKDFVARYGGYLPDIVSDAEEIYLEAYEDYDPKRGSLSNWLRYKIWLGLQKRFRAAEQYEKRLERYKLRRQQDIDSTTVYTEEFLRSLSDDAALVVQLTLDLPEELRQGGKRRGGEPRHFLKSIWYFLDGFGWSAKRIAETFREIRRALR